MATDRIFDQLICFLGDPIFQIPVRTFMDEHCVIFDPTIEPGKEHEQVHAHYKKLVDTLLVSFCQDAGITLDEAIKGVQKLEQIPDLKEVFQVLFEQVLSSSSYKIFCQMMTKRNIMIQEQVLVMIIAATGSLPESLAGQSSTGASKKSARPAPASHDADEEKLLEEVMRKSKAEHDAQSAAKKREDDELRKTLDLSKTEMTKLRQQRQQMEDDLNKMAISEKPVESSKKATEQFKPPSLGRTPDKSAPVTQPKLDAAASKMSGSEAASQWLKSAQNEATQSNTHSAMMANFSQMSPDELKRRQQYLKEQRDKLLAMKKEAREKQLGAAAKSQPERPQSARAARAAMSQTGSESGVSEEDAKRIAMRKAIAEKLKQEVIGKN